MGERKYQMIRIAAGDYLLPSNDTQTLWRIVKIKEMDTEKLRDVEVWEALYHETPLQQLNINSFDPDDWTPWRCWETWIPTRRDAISIALTAVTKR